MACAAYQRAVIVFLLLRIFLHAFVTACAARRATREPLDSNVSPARRASHSSKLRFHRVQSEAGGQGEHLVLRGKLNGKSCIWLLDTGFAGPPVLSMSYLAYLAKNDAKHADIAKEYHEVARRIRSIKPSQRTKVMTDFMQTGQCDAYTSGCSMRLMGISSIVEQQADLLLCSPILFQSADDPSTYLSPRQTTGNAAGDVCVTNVLPHTPHILTTDWLFHCSPIVLRMEDEVMEVGVDKAASSAFHKQPLRLMGGAVLIDMVVGGTQTTVTMDTGAPGGISLGKHMIRKLKCTSGELSISQIGVNNETICSTLVNANVSFCGSEYEDVCVFLNDSKVHQTDGYVGMGFLRAFDIYISKTNVGFSRNGLPWRTTKDYASDRSVSNWACNEKRVCASP